MKRHSPVIAVFATVMLCLFVSGAVSAGPGELDAKLIGELRASFAVDAPTRALMNAVTAGRMSSGCNRNFIRDDALLIVVMLTDENDSSDPDEQEWFDTLVAAKGVEENIVMLSLIWDSSWNNCESSLSESDGYQIEAFTQMFTNHAVGNICESSYAGFFANAIPTISGACEQFVPVE